MQQNKDLFPGGQIVLRRNGKLVLNESIGIARGYRPKESKPPKLVQSQTPFPVLSAGKPLAAVVIAMLEDRGLIDVELPIAHYFPKFAEHGKESITTLDVLTHRSGILMPDFVKCKDLWGDREAVQKALVQTIPSYPRGTLAYHPYEYGWILTEIVTRIDGRSLPDFFKEEIALPLHLPTLLFGLDARDVNSLAYSYWLGKDKEFVAGVNVAENFEWQNSEQFFNARNPAVSLVCDAASLAAFYDFLLDGGKTSVGKQLITERIIRKYTSRHVLSWDRSLKAPMALGRGFVVGTRFPSSFGWWNTNQCFGHGGGFSSLAFGDYSKNISVAIVTNGNRNLSDSLKRFLSLAHGLRRACK
jgi:CubicO group peptidase (beta-lactamase class C family)